MYRALGCEPLLRSGGDSKRRLLPRGPGAKPAPGFRGRVGVYIAATPMSVYIGAIVRTPYQGIMQGIFGIAMTGIRGFTHGVSHIVTQFSVLLFNLRAMTVCGWPLGTLLLAAARTAVAVRSCGAGVRGPTRGTSEMLSFGSTLRAPSFRNFHLKPIYGAVSPCP